MKKKRKTWQSKLTKAQLKHLKEVSVGRVTLDSIRQLREYQQELKAESGREPCWECRFIAKTLGLED